MVDCFPQAGDAVLLTGTWSWASELPVGSVGIIDGAVGQRQERLGVTWRFSAFRGFSSFGCPEHDNRKPSYYTSGMLREDEPVYVSCSGGPGTIALPARLLTPTDRTWHTRFWAWRTGPCANGGFDYYLDVPLWEWDGKGYEEE